MSDIELIDSSDDREIRLSMTAANIQLPVEGSDSEKEEDEDD